MIKVEKSNTLVETINKMLNKGAKIQLEYNHQRGTIKILDCSPEKIIEVKVEE